MITADIVQGKNVLLRADLDVPVKGGRVENSFRLMSLLPTLELCLQHAHRTCLIGHLGRPQNVDRDLSLIPVLHELKRLINREITFINSGFSPGECWGGEFPIALMENLRYDSREELVDMAFASELSLGADIYIYDAFASYRPSTSLLKIPEVIPTHTGIQFDKEVKTLGKILDNPHHPTLLIASGAKEDKLETINQISHLFDQVLLGGKFAKSEHLTSDGLDINDSAILHFSRAISEAKTVVLNGPLGMFEDGIHSKATREVLQALKDAPAFTILGGGDTIAAITALGFNYSDFDFVSTGGGAMLEYLATGTHPLLEILPQKVL